MPKKLNPKWEGGKEPKPNVLRKGQHCGGYEVVSDPPPPEAKHPVPYRQYKGESPRRLRSWRTHRPKATGHR